MWSSELEIQYLKDLKEQIVETCDFAKKKLQKSSQHYKKWYDRKTKIKRQPFNLQDKVLILLPTDNNKLFMQGKVRSLLLVK